MKECCEGDGLTSEWMATQAHPARAAESLQSNLPPPAGRLSHLAAMPVI